MGLIRNGTISFFNRAAHHAAIAPAINTEMAVMKVNREMKT